MIKLVILTPETRLNVDKASVATSQRTQTVLGINSNTLVLMKEIVTTVEYICIKYASGMLILNLNLVVRIVTAGLDSDSMTTQAACLF
jgi:hypothetical protein